MNHESFKELITEYLLNGSDMPNDLRQEFEEHFLTCNECWEVLDAQRVMLGVLEEEADQIFSEVDVEELMEYAESFYENGKFKEASKYYKEAALLSGNPDAVLFMAELTMVSHYLVHEMKENQLQMVDVKTGAIMAEIIHDLRHEVKGIQVTVKHGFEKDSKKFRQWLKGNRRLITPPNNLLTICKDGITELKTILDDMSENLKVIAA